MSSPAQPPMDDQAGVSHPAWCDPRHCVAGIQHVGTPIIQRVEHGDVELSLSRHRYFSDTSGGQECLLTARHLEEVHETWGIVLTRGDFIRLNQAHFVLDGYARAAIGEFSE